MKLVNFDTARALQSLGYDEEFTYIYRPDGTLDNMIDYIVLHEPITENYIPAPRLDDAWYFLRDKHHIGLRLNGMRFSVGEEFNYILYDNTTGRPLHDHFAAIGTYDDALEAAVTKAIEIIKNN